LKREYKKIKKMVRPAYQEQGMADRLHLTEVKREGVAISKEKKKEA
jgi:hypothetical protein